MRKKSEIRRLKPSELDLSNKTKLYINGFVSLLQGIVESVQKAVNKQRIFSFFTVDGSITLKIRNIFRI